MLLLLQLLCFELFGAIGLVSATEFGSASCRGLWVLDVFRLPPALGFGLLLRIISVPIAVPPGACSRHLCLRCVSCEPFVTLIYNIERLA